MAKWPLLHMMLLLFPIGPMKTGHPLLPSIYFPSIDDDCRCPSPQAKRTAKLKGE
jgi:hypothetical protein